MEVEFNGLVDFKKSNTSAPVEIPPQKCDLEETGKQETADGADAAVERPCEPSTKPMEEDFDTALKRRGDEKEEKVDDDP